MFDTTKQNLKDLLRLVHKGRLQLPDFQRDYVWGDEDVRSLVASVAKGFPIGALLTLQIRNDDFESFFESRMQALSEIIAEAMEKPVVAEAGTDEAEHDVEIEDDEMAELEAAA